MDRYQRGPIPRPASRVNKLHPRALLTPLTDNVSLTAGDRRAYSTQAQAQRMKGFEAVDVHQPDEAPDEDPVPER